jgi:hypothetical protein
MMLNELLDQIVIVVCQESMLLTEIIGDFAAAITEKCQCYGADIAWKRGEISTSHTQYLKIK